ncbi:tRNA (adenosine(37)-N6)-threonylcarbamoyltransferase complex ATPase subunit type 1 TsaE [Lutimonas zeaxanthinifaciens]|uniref:tRNA (adenosine(37)-N6)-threonylcarbamoyltransferase complex ATPase subunit type 1 TsaE n=1 Tax=Lutimonas zeaxanthinifaciens TaxID=3060215 RepID=UPI00265CA251|nr:tRNA (adenosine(37)-N6)-threonylcarbamoyltransferase complex ATPase subunit type 1 TsaE [Lutimonas sp. YSD2104]WKK64828.1 tRNA (adenosine(37)-N6)-threonylcarbamoyltransferase complex ATPase subunit type 1 TsaE [Lutimonas sp. YSD2104]
MKQRYNLDQISKTAQWVLKNCKSRILLFDGPMGSGKTTLIKEISNHLGVKDVTSSPTFSLVNEYLSNTGETVYHFDFYRIEDEEEAFDMGIEEYLDSGSWCFIEWPDKVQNLLPLESDVIKLTINQDNSRTIEIS